MWEILNRLSSIGVFVGPMWRLLGAMWGQCGNSSKKSIEPIKPNPQQDPNRFK